MEKKYSRETQYYQTPVSICDHNKKFDTLFLENVSDIADITAQTLVVLGLPISKMAKTKKVIINIFKFYDVKRHRFCSEKAENQLPTLNFKVVAGILTNKCEMTNIEAEVSFKIIRIVVKSFYLHTPEHTVRNAITEALLLKKEKYAWEHAANKIIRDFKPYTHIFYYSYPKYENMVKILFDDLYKRIKGRASPVLYTEYFPNGSIVKHIVHDPTDKPALNENDENESNARECKFWLESKDRKKFEGWNGMPPKQFFIPSNQNSLGLCDLIVCRKDGKRLCDPEETKNVAKPLSTNTQTSKCCTTKLPPTTKKVDMNVPRCFKCNAPKLFCYCNINQVTGLVAVDCSQGPYQCQWVHKAKTNNLSGSDGVCQRAEFHQCPIDCTDSLDFSSSDADVFDKCEHKVCKKKKVKVIVSPNTLHDSSDDEERLNRVLKSDLMDPLKVICKGSSVKNQQKL